MFTSLACLRSCVSARSCPAQKSRGKGKRQKSKCGVHEHESDHVTKHCQAQSSDFEGLKPSRFSKVQVDTKISVGGGSFLPGSPKTVPRHFYHIFWQEPLSVPHVQAGGASSCNSETLGFLQKLQKPNAHMTLLRRWRDHMTRTPKFHEPFPRLDVKGGEKKERPVFQNEKGKE